MQLRSLRISELKIPFQIPVQHSSASRASTEAVIVEAVTKTGARGFGEGCPRRYVTGESIASAIEFFNAFRTDLLKINSISTLREWMTQRRAIIDKNPGAFCALELALINALAAENACTPEELLGLPPLLGKFFYTGILANRDPKTLRPLFNRYLNMGFRCFKLKLFGDEKVDRPNLAMLKNNSACGIDFRLDANNYWRDADQALRYIKKLDLGGYSLEEPLIARDLEGMHKIFTETGSRIILDESLVKAEDLGQIRHNPLAWVINLRISKLGGLIRSIEIAKFATKLGIPMIVGAQVGETSILTRAGLTIANTFREGVVAQEGAFGTYLLKKDVVENPIMFGRGGIVYASNVAPNLGETVTLI